MFTYTYVYIVKNGRTHPFHGLVAPIKWTLRWQLAGVSTISCQRNWL